MDGAVELDLTEPADFGLCLKRAVRLLMWEADNMKPAELARRTKLPYNTLNAHLKLHGPDVTGPELKAIADALDTTPQRIYDIAGELSEGRAIRAECDLEVLDSPYPVQLRLESPGYRPFLGRDHLASVG